MYKIKLTARAKRELKNISILHQEAISFVFEELKDDPLLGKPWNSPVYCAFDKNYNFFWASWKEN
jgi:mRNA-degrading endonuclease RelE of RelBE toxin-antitoxin system